ncbi:dTDP-4-dehydrorhamnose 3,5-epimerase [Photobacterium leiognathi]|uniref:dTDP-4-dehydrorhamnose 3,5-epimerase n=1 Tax=Photobacterium leiognathi TaxID=553611 RepID=UPI0029825311|nr:dTDP-4-dehydrorhamnose 3,5-epimerase [Photobacterium leiognathi]
MKVLKTDIEGLFVIEPKVFGDDRGFFLESWNEKKFNDAVGKEIKFVQDNHSKSNKGVLRGLHLQLVNPQAKLVRVVSGSVIDVVVDLRKDSITFGKSFAIEISDTNKKQLFIPKGFAHGFLTLEDNTEFLYKCDEYYDPKSEISILWNDEEISIDWEKYYSGKYLLSEKDKLGMTLVEYRKKLGL